MSADSPDDDSGDEVGDGPVPPDGPRIDGDKVLFSCATCGKELRTDRRRAGQATACPQCGDRVVVPDTGLAPLPPSGERPGKAAGPVECPMCGTENVAGAVSCAVCGERLTGTGGRRGPYRRRVGTVDLGETFREGWRLTTEHYGAVLGGVLLTGLLTLLLWCVIGGPFQVAGLFITGQFPPRPGGPVRPAAGEALAQAGFQSFGQVLAMAAGAFFTAGFVRLQLNVARRGRGAIDDLFSESGTWAAAAVSTAILALIGIPAGLTASVAMSGEGGLDAIGLWPITLPTPAGPQTIFDFDAAWMAATVVLWGFGLWVTVLIWPYLFLVVDYRLGGVEALSAALTVTRGSRWQLLGLLLVQGLVGGAAYVMCFVPLLFVAPLLCLWSVATYEQIAGNLAAAADRAAGLEA